MVFETLVGRPRMVVCFPPPTYTNNDHDEAYENNNENNNNGVYYYAKSCYVGMEAREKSGILSLNFPVERGLVTHWDDLEEIWHYIFYNQINTDKNNTADGEGNPNHYGCHPVILTEPPQNPKAHRERMTQIIFEVFNAPALYINSQVVFALWGTGRTTGCVVDSGDGGTSIVPIYENCILTHAMIRMDEFTMSGREVTDHLLKVLSMQGLDVDTFCRPVPQRNRRTTIREIKEKICFVALDYEEALSSSSLISDKSFEYEISDGIVLPCAVVGNACFSVPEILFQPRLLQNDISMTTTASTAAGASIKMGIAEYTFHSISKCDSNLHAELFQNILLSGGNTMFRGMKERLQKDIATLVANGAATVSASGTSHQVAVVAPPFPRQYAAWKGASVLSSLQAFGSMCITVDDYNDHGPAVVHQLRT